MHLLIFYKDIYQNAQSNHQEKKQSLSNTNHEGM
jgi:hypothetical protein